MVENTPERRRRLVSEKKWNGEMKRRGKREKNLKFPRMWEIEKRDALVRISSA